MPDEMLYRGRGFLLGEDTRTADGRTVCARCTRPIGPGAREAKIPGSQDWAHVQCLAPGRAA